MASQKWLIVTAFLCIWASQTALKSKNNNYKSVQWMLIAVLFCVLALVRLLQWEEAARVWLETEFLAAQDYADRRTWQGPLVAIILVIGFVGTWASLRRLLNYKNEMLRSFYLAEISVIGLLCLIALRIISFHATDQILYGMRLNWVIDPALTLAVAGAAFWTIRNAR